MQWHRGILHLNRRDPLPVCAKPAPAALGENSRLYGEKFDVGRLPTCMRSNIASSQRLRPRYAAVGAKADKVRYPAQRVPWVRESPGNRCQVRPTSNTRIRLSVPSGPQPADARRGSTSVTAAIPPKCAPFPLPALVFFNQLLFSQAALALLKGLLEGTRLGPRG